jgi:hypothetical protein
MTLPNEQRAYSFEIAKDMVLDVLNGYGWTLRPEPPSGRFDYEKWKASLPRRLVSIHEDVDILGGANVFVVHLYVDGAGGQRTTLGFPVVHDSNTDSVADLIVAQLRLSGVIPSAQ